MDEETIRKILFQDSHTKQCFKGVFARNELPTSFDSYPACFVFNTQIRTQPGEHWLAIYIDKNKFARFFDSYGLSPAYYNVEFYLRKISNKWTWNQKQIQGLSQYCGLYCILFLIMASRHQLSNFYNQFTSNQYKNDKLIQNLINKNSI